MKTIFHEALAGGGKGNAFHGQFFYQEFSTWSVCVWRYIPKPTPTSTSRTKHVSPPITEQPNRTEKDTANGYAAEKRTYGRAGMFGWYF